MYCLLQIKTGNEGLNLQHYNEAYFVTPELESQSRRASDCKMS